MISGRRRGSRLCWCAAWSRSLGPRPSGALRARGARSLWRGSGTSAKGRPSSPLGGVRSCHQLAEVVITQILLKRAVACLERDSLLGRPAADITYHHGPFSHPSPPSVAPLGGSPQCTSMRGAGRCEGLRPTLETTQQRSIVEAVSRIRRRPVAIRCGYPCQTGQCLDEAPAAGHECNTRRSRAADRRASRSRAAPPPAAATESPNKYRPTSCSPRR